MQVGGIELLVETVTIGGSEPTSGLASSAQKAVIDAFGRAQHAIVAVAEATMQTISDMGRRAVRPDELEIKFGLKFSAQGNVIVAGAAGEAALEVTMTYRASLSEAGEDGH
jgi:hypothetical protein